MTKEEKENLWKELWIRFNTSPKLYQKQDFGILMRLLKGLSDSDGGGSGEIIVNPTGEGNVVSNITADGNVLNITKSKVQSKEYFPDFAFWQKPGAKKGAQVLWSPAPRTTIDNGTEFGYHNNGELPFMSDFWIQIGSISSVDYDGDAKPVYKFQNIDLKTIQKRLQYLLSLGVITEQTQIPIKIGLLNKIHTELKQPAVELQLPDGEIKDDYYGNLTFKFNAIDIINKEWDEIKLQTHDKRAYNELHLKLYPALNPACNTKQILQIYCPLSIYFADCVQIQNEYGSWIFKNVFHILQYYQKRDVWELLPIENRTIRVKYHTTEYYITGNKIERNTYRDYPQPNITNIRSLQLSPETLVKIMTNSECNGQAMGRRKTRFMLAGRTQSKLWNEKTLQMDVPRKRIFIVDKNKYRGYILISQREAYKKCGHQPRNGRWFVGSKRKYMTYRRQYRVFYKSQIPIFRIQLNSFEQKHFVSRGNVQGNITFQQYIMPKIAY